MILISIVRLIFGIINAGSWDSFILQTSSIEFATSSYRLLYLSVILQLAQLFFLLLYCSLC